VVDTVWLNVASLLLVIIIGCWPSLFCVYFTDDCKKKRKKEKEDG